MSQDAGQGQMDARVLLREHFRSQPGSVSRWDELWKSDFTPWDRGFPNPALVDTLNDKQDILGKPIIQGGNQRKKALVPGCGRGYDVLLLASMGYDAVGLDGSEAAIEACQKLVAERKPQLEKETGVDGLGKISFIKADFFAREWEEQMLEGQKGFDMIYDYTVRLYTKFCGIQVSYDLLVPMCPAARPASTMGWSNG
jgi:hypothetical protein